VRRARRACARVGRRPPRGVAALVVLAAPRRRKAALVVRARVSFRAGLRARVRADVAGVDAARVHGGERDRPRARGAQVAGAAVERCRGATRARVVCVNAVAAAGGASATTADGGLNIEGELDDQVTLWRRIDVKVERPCLAT
jgi:hypothetical protein